MSFSVSNLTDQMNLGLAKLRLHYFCRYSNRNRFTPLPAIPSSMMQLFIPNPIGLAAGMDKVGKFVGLLDRTGFGFMEIGSGSPENLVKALSNLRQHRTTSKGNIVGVNVLCSRGATGSDAIRQYVSVSQSCLPFADYLVLNLSSSFAGEARAYGARWIESLLNAVSLESDIGQQKLQRHVPLAVKVSFENSERDLAMEILQIAKRMRFDGAIVVHPKEIRNPEFLLICGRLRIRRVTYLLSQLAASAQQLKFLTG